MSTAVTIARLDKTATGDVISSTTNGDNVVMGTGTAGVVCNEAIGICACLSVAAAGNATITIEGSVDGGTTFSTLGTFGVVSAASTKTVRLTNTAPIVRWKSVLNSGTSVTCVILVVGLVPTDSYLVSDTAVVAV